MSKDCRRRQIEDTHGTWKCDYCARVLHPCCAGSILSTFFLLTYFVELPLIFSVGMMACVRSSFELIFTNFVRCT